MHFSRKRSCSNPPVYHGNHVKPAASPLRWLCIILDGKLTFIHHVHHVNYRTKKANRVADHLRSLCNRVRCLSVRSAKKAVTACVVPILAYGLEAWYLNTERVTKMRNVATCGVQRLLRHMDATLRITAKAILPALKIHPSQTLHHNAQIPPAALLAEPIRGKEDESHFLGSQASIFGIPCTEVKDSLERYVSANCKPDTRRHGLTAPSIPPDPGSRTTPSSGFVKADPESRKTSSSEFVKAEVNACSIPPYGYRKGEHPFSGHYIPFSGLSKLLFSALFTLKFKTLRKSCNPVCFFVGRSWGSRIMDLSLNPDLGLGKPRWRTSHLPSG